MKRLMTLIFAVALLAVVVSAQAEDPIIGEWHSVSLISGGIAQDIKDILNYRIEDDGSVRELYSGSNSGTWSKNGDQYDFIPVDENVDKATFIIDGDNMTMDYDGNLQFTFVRANASAAKSATIETPKADTSGKDSNTEANLGVDDGVYYVYKGLPDYMEFINKRTAVSIYPTGQFNAREVPTDGSAVLTSEQDGNVSRLVFEKRDDDFWSYVAVGNPGKYDYHVTLESEHYVNEQDCSIYVFSWDENPLITLYDEHAEIAEITVKIGESFIPPELFDRVATDNTEQIVGSMGKTYDKDGFWFHFDNAALENEFTKEWITNKYYSYTAAKEGSYEGTLQHRLWGNVGLKVRINVVSVSGPVQVEPGQSAVYVIKDGASKDGRSFSWSVQGEGVTIDAGTGELQVAEDAVIGTAFSVIATPSDHSSAVILQCNVGNPIFNEDDLSLYEMPDGFSVPLLTNADKYKVKNLSKQEVLSSLADATLPYTLEQDYFLYDDVFDEFIEGTDSRSQMLAKARYDQFKVSKLQLVSSEDITIDGGHLARVSTYRDNGGGNHGAFLYTRNNRLISCWIQITPQNGADADTIPKITINDVKALAQQVVYDPAKAPVTIEDATIILTTKGNVKTMSPGESLQFVATYANPKKMKTPLQSHNVGWRAEDRETGDILEGITTNSSGLLTVDPSIDRVIQVRVRAVYYPSDQWTEYDITVIPKLSSFTVSPAEVFLYTGSDAATPLNVTIEPASIQLNLVTWALKKEGIAELIITEGGEVSLKAVSAGKTQLTGTAPGGKKETVKINVVEPVTEVTLSAKGKAAPGKTMTVSAALEPKKAGNKNLEWSLDVDETVATINAKGQVKIAREAAAGTVITVTCKALGAPEPVIGTLQITVE